MKSDLSITCRVCKSTNCRFYFYSKNYDFVNSGDFKYYKCFECSSIFIDKIPDDINKYYSDSYHPFKDDNDLDLKDKKNIITIQKLITSGNILELGIGNGKFLKKLKSIGYKCSCIEPFSKVTSELKKKDINVISKNLDNLNIEELNFKVDLIYAWHSIEHLYTFEIFLKLCKKILKKDGYVIVGTPNKNSLSFKFYQNYWYHLQAPMHSFLIDSKQIEKQFAKIGFKKIKFISDDKVSILSSKYGWETSGYLLKKKNGMKLYSYLGKFFSLFMPYLEAILNRSSQYTIIFKR